MAPSPGWAAAMSDIFISYSRQDRQRVEALAALLEGAGWSVWWDRHIKGGSSFDKLIEEQIQQAKAVVVAWSRDSVQSDWVRAEATFALERHKLLPVRLDECLPPLRFTHVQTEDLSRWDGHAAGTDALRRLFADLSALIDGPAGREPALAQRDVEPARRRRYVPAVLAGTALLAGGAVAWVAAPWRSQSPPAAESTAPTPPAEREAAAAAPVAPPVAASPPSQPALEILDQDMVALRTAPLRAAPQITAPQLGTLAAGRTVHVAGRVRDGAWYAVQPADADGLRYVASAALADVTAKTAKTPAARSPGAAAAPLMVASATPAQPSAPAPAAATAPAAAPAPESAAGFDGTWKGIVRCPATKNMPPTNNEGFPIEIVGGTFTAELPQPAAGAGAHGSYRGMVLQNGALNINGTVTNGRRGNYTVSFRGRIEGNQLRANGFLGTRQCLLNYTRQ